MSKIRTVKPELFRHEQLFEAEQESNFPLRLIFIGLFTVVDAEGRFRWRPRQLKLDILPYDEMDFSAALSALVKYGFVQKYDYQGECYGFIPTWRKHQSINQREPDSILPDPSSTLAIRSQIVPTPMYAGNNQNKDKNMSTQTVHRPLPSLIVQSVENEPPQDLTPTVSENLILEQSVSNERLQINAIPCTDSVTPSHVSSMPNSAAHIPNQDAHVLASLEMEMEMEMEEEVEQEKEKEKEKEEEWKNQNPHTRAAPDPITKIFSHWQAVMNHPKAVLDKQRRRFIQQALDNGYSADDLCQAIIGCSLTPHNQGQNDRGERYDGLHLILRSADQIDRFIRNAQHPPKVLSKAEQRFNHNVQAAQSWLQQEA